MSAHERYGAETSVNARITDEAIDWVERLDREDWGAQDQRDIDLWLSASAAHTVALLRVQDKWRRADRLVALRGTLAPPSSGNSPPKRFMWSRIVAGALLLCGSMLWLSLFNHRPTAVAFETRVGGHRVVALNDGSKVELNTDSAVRIQIDSKHSMVHVDRGEVYFDIVHRSNRSFVVLAQGERIMDLGTKFVVRDEPNDLRITLIEGSAQVDIPAKPRIPHVRLMPGDSALTTADAVLVVKRSPQTVRDELAWRHGELVLNHTTLVDAAAQMNRYNARKIVIADVEAGQQRIDGTFPTTNVELFGRVARTVLGLHVTRSGNDVVISR